MDSFVASFVQYCICVCAFSLLYSSQLCEYRFNYSTIYGPLLQIFIRNNASMTPLPPHSHTRFCWECT